MEIILVHAFAHPQKEIIGKILLVRKSEIGNVLAQSDLKWSIRPGERLMLVNVFTKGEN